MKTHTIKGNIYFCMSSGSYGENLGAGKVGKMYFMVEGQEAISIKFSDNAEFKMQYGSFAHIKEVSFDAEIDDSCLAELIEKAAESEREMLQAGLDKLEKEFLAKKVVIEAKIASLFLIAAPKAEDDGAVVGDFITCDYAKTIKKFSDDEAEDVPL